jgi:hypothetical protein
MNQPFRPAGTLTVAASTANARGALVGGGNSVLVFNSTTSVAFVRFGTDSTVTATAADTPIPPGLRMLVDAGPFIQQAAVLLASGTGNVYFSRGDGTTY